MPQSQSAATRSHPTLVAPIVVSALVSALVAAIPTPTGLVTDAAGVLGPQAEQAIAATLQQVEGQTTAQIAVVTVPSLDDLSIEAYAERLFREWGIGQRGRDNGVLILVAPSDRQVRIEVGYGLEPVLPDGLAGAIIREQALPAFKAGDLEGGIQATAVRVAQIVLANEPVSAEERARLAAATAPSTWLTTPFFGLFVGVGALGLGGGLRARALFPIGFGLLFGGLAFLIALLPFNNVSLPMLAAIASATAWFGWSKAGGGAWRDAFAAPGCELAEAARAEDG